LILPGLIGGLIIGVLVAVGGITGGIFTRNNRQSIANATPILKIIPAPSRTPTPQPTNTPVILLATATSTSAVFGTGEISEGQLVEIFGTGGDNLRLRTSPGLNSAIAFLGVESEVFEVLDGPQELDGYVWWFLRNPYNPEKTGWAVSVYLRPITTP
jgi:hypothetical protein